MGYKAWEGGLSVPLAEELVSLMVDLLGEWLGLSMQQVLFS